MKRGRNQGKLAVLLDTWAPPPDLLVRVGKGVGIVSGNRVENVSRVRRPGLVLAVGLDAVDELRAAVLQCDGVAVVLVKLIKLGRHK